MFINSGFISDMRPQTRAWTCLLEESKHSEIGFSPFMHLGTNETQFSSFPKDNVCINCGFVDSWVLNMRSVSFCILEG